MSATRDVDVLLKDARKLGLKVEMHGSKWRVTNEESGGQAFVPTKGQGRSLANIRAELRRLADRPAPMVAAVAPPGIEEDAVGWPIEQLLTLAEQQGVRVDVRGGLLHVSGPVEAEPFARLLRDREADVLHHLNPTHESETSVPKIRDVARIDHPAPARDVAADAQEVWRTIRDLARHQGDEQGLNAGVPGVLWRGAMARVMRETRPEWADDYRREVSVFLERSGHARCQSRDARPPVWWIRSEWSSGDLKVTKTTPKPAKPKANGAEPAVALPDVGDPLAMLTAVAKRVSDAEQRAADAEELLAEALAENETLRTERDQYKAQVEEIGKAFRVLAGGSQ
ncbi:hypothetical protein ABZ917_17785 [Nonomuraea wenchangensis]